MKLPLNRSLIILALSLIILMGLSYGAVKKFQGGFAGLTSWHLWGTSSKEEDQLKLENRLLKNRISELELLHGTKPLEGALPAQVISRSVTNWNSTLWINVGERDNEVLSRIAVAKESPVVVGDAVVGVVELVEASRSRVRLLSDPDVNIAVRASREGEKLAKGELHGSAEILWRARGTQLTGEGFNYDFQDEEGAARDLRSSILKVGDLLITTGMDGVFPPNLRVATVIKVFPLREGDYAYTLEATPVVASLEELKLVYVLPPQ